MKIKRKNIIVFLMLTILFSLCTPLHAENSNNTKVEKPTITVAIQRGEGINNESLTDDYIVGYTHEYLSKLEQFSPVNFEFIFFNANDEELMHVFKQVSEGKIDLLGGILKNSGIDEGFIFSDSTYGYASTSLLAKVDNLDVNERVLLKHEEVTIGVNTTSKAQKEYFEQYCVDNKINPKIVEYNNYRESEKALLNDEVDMIVGRDTSRSSEIKVVLNIIKTPYYFITADNKTSVMNTINEAMRELKIIDPEFEDNLYEKYYATPNISTALTMKEKEIIQELPILKVGVIPDNYPLQYYDDTTREFKGILVDIMNLISENTGLNIEYVKMKNTANITEEFKFGVMDMVLGVPMEYDRANKNSYLLTSAIVKLPIVRISNRFSSNSEEIAMSGYLNLDNKFAINYSDEELFKMISDGKYKEAYMDGYRAKYFSPNYPNVIVIPSIYENYQLAIGFYDQNDYRIMSILEQGIRGIGQQKIDDIIYNNVINTEKLTLTDYFRQNPVESVGFIVFSALTLVSVLSFFLYKANQMKKELSRERKKYEYLAQFDGLTKVYNQQTFKDKVQSCIDRKSSGTIISMDLDNFKSINDTQGHLEGDKILEEFGKQLGNTFGDYVSGRLGGDEFMVYLDEVQDEQLIYNLCKNLLHEIDSIDKDYKLTISIGAIIFNTSTDFDDLYLRVDEILYEVKNSGRNNIKIEIIN